MEMFFYYLHAFIAITITLLMRFKETKIILDYIWEFENNYLNKEDAEAKRLYMDYAKLNSRTVAFIIFIGNVAGWSWYFVGRK